VNDAFVPVHLNNAGMIIGVTGTSESNGKLHGTVQVKKSANGEGVNLKSGELSYEDGRFALSNTGPPLHYIRGLKITNHKTLRTSTSGTAVTTTTISTPQVLARVGGTSYLWLTDPETGDFYKDPSNPSQP